MKKLMVLACTLLSSTHVYAEAEPHWGYSGEGAAENWVTLSTDNFACSGKNQSPINLSGFIEADLSPIQFNYQSAGHEIINNGHTIQVNYQSGSNIEVDGIRFDLLQYHFHAPSENHINGKSYPLEVHLVHADKVGNLAVVAVMFEEGVANKGLAATWSSMPQSAGDKHALSPVVAVDDILPTNREHYRFNGSLTTPPCSEGVRWLIMKDSVMASKQQIEAFEEVLHEPNNRPLQPINSRVILQ